MYFIVKILLPIFLFIGFIAYYFKAYFHFSYLKIIKKYPKKLSFFRFSGFENVYFIDWFEIIIPFLFRRKKNNLSDSEIKKAIKLEKRIIICIIIFLSGFATIPLGIYLQNRFNI